MRDLNGGSYSKGAADVNLKTAHQTSYTNAGNVPKTWTRIHRKQLSRTAAALSKSRALSLKLQAQNCDLIRQWTVQHKIKNCYHYGTRLPWSYCCYRVRPSSAELRPLTGPLSLPQMIRERTWSSDGMTLTGENWRTGKETCPSATTNATAMKRARTRAATLRIQQLIAWADLFETRTAHAIHLHLQATAHSANKGILTL
jgi:hypothetical protein